MTHDNYSFAVSAQGVLHLLRCRGLEVREVRLRPLRLASVAPSEQIRVKKNCCVKGHFPLWEFSLRGCPKISWMMARSDLGQAELN